MQVRSRRVAGFSLIELMITVAIIGILASIAVPSFKRMQMRSKASEGRSNLASIRTHEESFQVEYATYIAGALTPAAPPTEPLIWPGEPGFDLLGWNPDGAIMFQYAVTTNAAPGVSATAYTAEAGSDLDLNLVLNRWGYVQQSSLGVGVPGVLGCQASGVWDTLAGAATLVNTVGPCDAGSASSIF